MAGKTRFTEWIKTICEGYGVLLAHFELFYVQLPEVLFGDCFFFLISAITSSMGVRELGHTTPHRKIIF